MLIDSHPSLVWCPTCRHYVEPANLRPWPSGELAIGECPSCNSQLAARKPPEWRSEPRDSTSPR